LAEFLFTTWEGGGHVTPALIAARDLRARGHDVLVVSDACNAPDAEGFGVPFRPWPKAPSRQDKRRETDPLKDYEASAPAELLDRLCERILVGPALAYGRDTQALLAERPGATVVCQELLFGAMLGAEAAGAPLALLTANLWPFPTLPGVPPFGAGFEPGVDDAGRMRDQAVTEVVRRLYDGWTPRLNAVRAELGLSPVDHLLDQPHRADRILLGVSPVFDFAPEFVPEPFEYVGPQFADPVWAQAWTAPWPSDDPRPLVLVSFSTFFQGQTEAVRRAAAALGDLPVRGLVLLGPALDAAEIGAPDNVVVAESAPFSAVLPLAAAVVTHAGHASVVRPLLAGVPVVCTPLGRDQPDNAARVAARGAGLVLPPDAASDQIAAAVRRVLDEPAFRDAARSLGRAIAARHDPDAAVRALERLAAGGLRRAASR
jgi:MGT family glycosyltransferase